MAFYWVEYGDKDADVPHSGQGSITTGPDAPMYQDTTIGFLAPERKPVVITIASEIALWWAR